MPGGRPNPIQVTSRGIAMNQKKGLRLSLDFKIGAIFFPLMWLFFLNKYLKSGCVQMNNFVPVCGKDGLIAMTLSGIVCFLIPFAAIRAALKR